MTPYVDDADFTLYVGDVRDVLAGLPDESVHCVVTSPPYWGLRDYGTGAWEGGDAECDHAASTNPGEGVGRTGQRDDMDIHFRSARYTHQGGKETVCGKCGARRVDKQLGLEPTPEEYVANMVAVFREVRRVLRRDGTCWLNIGDSYAQTERRHRHDTGPAEWGTRGGEKVGGASTAVSGLKPKDLCGIPWRLAFALQADGWYLRSDIIWSKPNPMPESVTDRPTKAHEYLFLLTRSARYFYDADAIREPAEWARWGDQTSPKNDGYRNGFRGEADGESAYLHQQAGTSNSVKPRAVSIPDKTKEELQAMASRGRNRRSVWEIATEPYPDAHFATFPQALVEPCILAGTSERGCCPECGAGWERETERTELASRERTRNVGGRSDGLTRPSGPGEGFYTSVETMGWRPSCDCIEIDRFIQPCLHGEPGDERCDFCMERLVPVPCTVLDPFMGSGTTALVARRHGRRSIGVELNETYARLAADRLSQLSLLAGVTA